MGAKQNIFFLLFFPILFPILVLLFVPGRLFGNPSNPKSVEEINKAEYNELIKKYGSEKLLKESESEKTNNNSNDSNEDQVDQSSPSTQTIKQNDFTQNSTVESSNPIDNLSEDAIYTNLKEKLKLVPFGSTLLSHKKLILIPVKIMKDPNIRQDFIQTLNNPKKLEVYRNFSIIGGGIIFLLTIIFTWRGHFFKKLIKRTFASLILFAYQIAIFSYFFPTAFSGIKRIILKSFT